jgi:hypothetical protein
MIAAVIVGASIICASATVAEPAKRDPFHRETEENCDLRDGAPISERCKGFVSGIARMIAIEAVRRSPYERARRMCLPPDIGIEGVIARIRPQLRHAMSLNCTGLCTFAVDVEYSLYVTFPCQPAPH